MIKSTLKRQVTMPRWRFKASEASLRLVLLLIFLEETPRSASLVGGDDEDFSPIRTTWCEVRNVCAACRPSDHHPRSRPKCFGQDEPLLGKDLCECCLSCVAIRESGESCGAQLSVWFEDAILGSTVSILATTRCEKGLACANFICEKLMEADASVILVQDAITLDVETVFDNQDASMTRDNDNRNPDDGFYIPETAKAVSLAASAPSKTSSSLPLENAASYNTSLKSSTFGQPMVKNSQPCYGRTNEQRFEIDDPLHQVVEVFLSDKRFQLAYNTEDDLLAELEIMLSVIDRRYLGSLMGEDGLDSLVKGFGAFYLENGSVNASKPGGESEVLPELRKLVYSEPSRAKREQAPKNIGEVLVRSASAHREYTDADRFHHQVRNTSSAEAPSQGDESTVRVRITTHPRKVHTSIDLEEEEEEEKEEEEKEVDEKKEGHDDEDEELSDDMKLAYGRRGEGKEDSRSRTNISRSRKIHRVASGPEKGVVVMPKTTNDSNAMEIRWNKTVSALGDRLSSLELRIGVFERVLEEMAKWCNLGSPATRDCMLPEDANLRVPGQWGFVYSDPEGRDRPSGDEDLALASGIDAVGLYDDRRRLLSGNVPPLRKEHDSARHPVTHRVEDFFDSSQPQLQNHRTVFPIRRLGGFRKWENRRPPDFLSAYSTGPRPCYRKSVRRGYSLMGNPSWQEPIDEAVAESPIHRPVQRSVLEAGQDEYNAIEIPETQIRKPNTPLSAIVPRDRVKNSNRSYIDQKKIVQNSDSDSVAMKNFSSGVGITELHQESEVSQRNSRRSRRSLDRDDHGISMFLRHDALRKIRSGSEVPRRDVERTTNLFKVQPQPREKEERVQGSWTKLSETDADLDALRRRFIRLPLIIKASESDSHSDNRRTATAIQGNRIRTLFKNNIETLMQSQDYPRTLAGKGHIKDLREPLQDSQSAITSDGGNSTIHIEEISDAEEYGGENFPPQLAAGGSSFSEDDFDHLYYENSKAENEDFDYTEKTKFEELGELKKPERKLDWSSVVSPRISNSDQRISRKTCESVKSDAEAERESRITLWPTKRIGRTGYRQDRLRIEPREEKRSGFEANHRRSVVATMLSPRRTMKINESSNPTSLKISDIERRVGKNGRRLVWQ